MSMADTGTAARPSTSLDEMLDAAWTVMLFDDPVNTMAYVAFALRTVLGIDGARAEQLMLEAHTTGKAAVFSGTRTEAEEVCVALHGWALHAVVVQ